MSDNVQANAATTAGAIFKTDQDSDDLSHAPFTKLMFGPMDTFTIVTASQGLPVEIVEDPSIYVDGDTWTDGVSKNQLNGGVYQTTPQVMNDGEVGPLQLDNRGFVRIALADQDCTLTVIAVGSLSHNTLNLPSVNPTIVGGISSAAAPTSVSGDGYVTQAWYLRNGAQATVLTAAGALIGGDATNGLDVDVTRCALPTGASTAANQTTVIAGLVSIDAHVDGLEASATSIDSKITACNTGAVVIASGSVSISGSVAVTGTFWQATQPISAAALPLPSGAATAANQTTELASLASIDGKITAVNTGAVVIASGTVTTVATVTNLAQMGGAAIAMGTGTRSSGTQRVTIATDDVVPASQSGTWTVGISAGQTIATVTTVTTVTTCSTVTTLTGSGVAHDAADSGNPHKIGAKATTSLSGKTLVAADDRTDLFAGVDGVQITRPHCNLEDIVNGNASNTDGTSTQCIAAQAAGVKTYLTTIILANSHATTSCTVDIKDGTTVKLTIPVPPGGAVVNLPIPLPGTAATAWNFDPSAAVTTITCSMIGFKSKV